MYNIEKTISRKRLSERFLAVILLFFLIIIPTLTVAAEKVTFENPLTISGEEGIFAFIGGVVIGKWLLGIMGSIALLMMIVGGIVWLTAAGNEERVNQSKAIIIWTLVGIVTILSAYTIASAILQYLGAESCEPGFVYDKETETCWPEENQ